MHKIRYSDATPAAPANTPGGCRLPPSRHLHRSILQLALAAGLPVLAVAACSAPPSPAGSMPAKPAACSPEQLELSLDNGNGRFNGMSHSGTMLVLRNTGDTPCTIPAQPLPRFTDANRQPLDISARDKLGQPARSASAAITLAPGARVGSDLRWVSGDVYDNGHCESPAFLDLALGRQTISVTFASHLCGAGGQPSTFTVAPFRPDAGDRSKQ